jgi:hypothetical protein
VRRGLVVAAGFLLPLALVELAYLAALGIGRITDTPVGWLDYAHQLVQFTRMNPPDRLRIDEWPTYLVDVALMDGPAVLALLLVGIGVVLWRVRSPARTRADLLLAGSLLLPLLLYSLYSTGEVRLRHFSMAIPWVMLTAALALDTAAGWLARRWRSRNATSLVHSGLMAGVVIVLALLALPRIISLDGAPAGMSAVVDSLGSGPVASTNGPVLSFYVGEDRTNARLRPAFVNVPDDLNALAARYPTLVVDMQASVHSGDLADIYARTQPRLAAANGSDAWYLADLLEHYGVTWGGWSNLLARWEANRADATQLRVYAMSQVLAARNAQ